MDLLRTISNGVRGVSGGQKAPDTTWSLLLDRAGALLTPPAAAKSKPTPAPEDSLERRGVTHSPSPADFLALAAEQSKLVYDHCGTLNAKHTSFNLAMPDVAHPEADGTIVAEIGRALEKNAQLIGTADNSVMVCSYTNRGPGGWPQPGQDYSQDWLCALAPLPRMEDGGPTQADLLTALESSGVIKDFTFRKEELIMSKSKLATGHRNLMIRPFFDGMAISGYLNQPHRFGGRINMLRLAITFANPQADGLMWFWAQATDGVMGA